MRTCAIVTSVTLLLLAGCAGSDESSAPDPAAQLCAPPAAACAAVTTCDHARPFTCGYGRGEAGGYGCAPWFEHEATDCPLQHEICRSAAGELVVCPRS